MNYFVKATYVASLQGLTQFIKRGHEELARTLHEQAAEERAFFANTLRFSSKQVTEDMLARRNKTYLQKSLAPLKAQCFRWFFGSNDTCSCNIRDSRNFKDLWDYHFW